MRRKHYVIIEGCIGLGKTTLAKALAPYLDARIMYEPTEIENPYLDDYYANPCEYAFKMQIHLLWRRYRAHQLAQCLVMQGERSVVSDRSYFGDRAFARVQRDLGYFDDRDYETYCKLHQDMARTLVFPSCVVLLCGSKELSLSRVKRRGRPCEASITTDYLQRVQNATVDEICALGSTADVFLTLDASMPVSTLVHEILKSLETRECAGLETYRSV